MVRQHHFQTCTHFPLFRFNTQTPQPADGWRQGRLVSSEYDETTWAARNYMAFVTQRISVAVQISLAQEIAEALGLSVAADPRE